MAEGRRKSESDEGIDSLRVFVCLCVCVSVCVSVYLFAYTKI